MADASDGFLARLPKAELHVHVEGTITAAQRRELARRAGIDPIPEDGLSAADVAPEVALRAFLSVYAAAIACLRTEQDYHDVVADYARQSVETGVVYAELSFDPQAHTSRGVPLEVVMAGLLSGTAAAGELGLETQLIMCFHRDRPPEEALELLRQAQPWRERIAGIGLDNNEDPGWAQAFRPVFDAARQEGYHLTSHCDCNMPGAAGYIGECLRDLDVERIDHGINVLEDSALVALAIDRGTCFTVCPTWRVGETAPRRVPELRRMLDEGLLVSVHSDDPGLFASGDVANIMGALAATGHFDASDFHRLASNSFAGSWLPAARRNHYLGLLDAYVETAATRR